MSIVAARHVSRAFGSFTAVDDVDLDIEPGEIVGLLGANGAGKTTLIRMLLGLSTPTAGTIRLFGGPIGRRQRRRVGYVPQHLGLYTDLTAAENLEFRAEVFGVGIARSPAHGAPLVGSLPLGAQRRVAFDAATLHAPELLILDEPTSGVSPLSRSRLWDLVHDQADAGVGVLVSTHYMDEAEQADRLVIMSRGRVVAEGSVAEVVGGRGVVEVTAERWSSAFRALDRPGRLLRLAGTDVRVVGDDAEQVRRELAAATVGARVSTVPATLDEVLIELDAAAPADRRHLDERLTR